MKRPSQARSRRRLEPESDADAAHQNRIMRVAADARRMVLRVMEPRRARKPRATRSMSDLPW